MRNTEIEKAYHKMTSKIGESPQLAVLLSENFIKHFCPVSIGDWVCFKEKHLYLVLHISLVLHDLQIEYPVYELVCRRVNKNGKFKDNQITRILYAPDNEKAVITRLRIIKQ